MRRADVPRLLTRTKTVSWSLIVVSVSIGATIGADALGLIAASISFILFIPQAAKAYEMRKNAEGMVALSASTQVLVMANATVWAIYGIETNALWVAAPGLVNGPLALLMLTLILRSRLTVRKTNDTGKSHVPTG